MTLFAICCSVYLPPTALGSDLFLLLRYNTWIFFEQPPIAKVGEVVVLPIDFMIHFFPTVVWSIKADLSLVAMGKNDLGGTFCSLSLPYASSISGNKVKQGKIPRNPSDLCRSRQVTD